MYNSNPQCFYAKFSFCRYYYMLFINAEKSDGFNLKNVYIMKMHEKFYMLIFLIFLAGRSFPQVRVWILLIKTLEKKGFAQNPQSFPQGCESFSHNSDISRRYFPLFAFY